LPFVAYNNDYQLQLGHGPLTLADLKPGDTATIRSIETGDPAVERLMVLGLVEDAVLTLVRRSLGGDPLEFRLFGAAISLRVAQAKRFHVDEGTRG
jgi:Fe2+ transport system protein FeoA